MRPFIYIVRFEPHALETTVFSLDRFLYVLESFSYFFSTQASDVLCWVVDESFISLIAFPPPPPVIFPHVMPSSFRKQTLSEALTPLGGKKAGRGWEKQYAAAVKFLSFNHCTLIALAFCDPAPPLII